MCCGCCGAKICSINGELTRDEHSQECPEGLLLQHRIWNSRYNQAMAEAHEARRNAGRPVSTPRENPASTTPAQKPKGSKSTLGGILGFLDWFARSQPQQGQSPLSSDGRGLTDFGTEFKDDHPEGVPIDPGYQQDGPFSAGDRGEDAILPSERSPLDKLQRGTAAESVAAVQKNDVSFGSLPSLDGAVHALKDGNRSYGPDQPLTMVIGGIMNSTSDNQGFLDQVGALRQNEGVVGVFNVRPGDRSSGPIDMARDLQKAIDTRWPDTLTIEQLGEIGAEHLSRVDVPRGFGSPLLFGPNDSMRLLRFNAKREGKIVEVERAIDNAIYENQVRANPSIATAQRLQEGKIRQYQELRMLVHSEGEIIASVVTKKTISNIENDPTLTPLQRNAMLGRIHVDSFGGAGDSAVIQQFEGRIGSWIRYRDPRDPIPQVTARPPNDSSDDTLFGGLGKRTDDNSFSTHSRDAYLEFVKAQRPDFLEKNRGTRGQIKVIPIKVR